MLLRWAGASRIVLGMFAAALALAGCGGNGPAPRARLTGPVTDKRSTAADRESVAITVYNQNFGLVREVRNLDLGRGRVSLELRDVAAQIEPQTVHIKPLGGTPDALSVLEQNYRYDLLTPGKLLEKYVDKKVKVYRWDEKTGQDRVVDAEVLSVAEGPVLRVGDEVTYGYPGRISFPEVPANLIAKPTLVWLLDSYEPKQKVEVTYLTRNLGWRADYVFAVNADDTLGDLTGWVTLNNQSGAAYKNAQLKLVAGDVQRVTTERTMDEEQGFRRPASTRDDSRFQEQSFFEYHLYSLDTPTDLLEKEQKQVSLLEASGVGVKKRLTFFGAESYYRSQYGTMVSNQKVSVLLEIENSLKNRLGMPLPKGIVRVYKADGSGAMQFIGEDAIDHTPRDEKLRIKMGEAFDVVGDRLQTDFVHHGTCRTESEWEISLRNHKDVATEVEVVEPAGGEWRILRSSQNYVKKDAHTFTFTAQVPARGEVKIGYRVEVTWCRE
jgi:hypothetical protein